MRRTVLGIIVLAIGAMMMLKTLGYADFDWFFCTDWKKYIIPALIILCGIKLMLPSHRYHQLDGFKECDVPEMASNDRLKVQVSFAGNSYNFDGHLFHGAYIDAFMGGASLDLRGAIIPEDCVIDIKTFMGGVEIWVPEDVNLKINSSCLAGGINNKVPNRNPQGAKTITVNASCFLGGVDLKY